VSVLVLGVGHILLGDEGVGVRAIEALAERYQLSDGVEVVDGGTAGFDLLDLLDSREAVILVDAIRSDSPPGSLVRIAGDAVAVRLGSRLSPHQLGLTEVLATLRLLSREPAPLTILGMVPASIELGLALSPTVAARLDQLVASIVAELGRLGVSPAPIVGRPVSGAA
jgi:hydrogenase maturation protease